MAKKRILYKINILHMEVDSVQNI